MILSQRAQAIEESVTLAITAKANELKAAGIPVINLSVGEPDMVTPAPICRAAEEAIRAGKTHYTAAAGDPALKKAVCGKLLRENGLNYSPKQIVISNGAKHALYNTFQAILNPGDEVIIPSPCWVSYPEIVKLSDGVPVLVKTREEDGFCPDPAALEAAVTGKTKALILCNPSNPTGAVIPEDTLRKIADLAVKYDFFLVSDEIYEHLIYNGTKNVSPAGFGPEAYAHTIVINGVSKAYAMTGWRIGYSASPLDVAEIIANLQSQATSAPNTIAQEAAKAAYEGSNDTIEEMRRQFELRRDYLCERISKIPGLSIVKPEGAFYAFVNVTQLLGKTFRGTAVSDDVDFARVFLEAYQVATVPGAGFEAPGYIRLSYAIAVEKLKDAADRLEAFAAELF